MLQTCSNCTTWVTVHCLYSSRPVHKVHGYIKRILHISVKAKVIIKNKGEGSASVVVHICPYMASPAEIACTHRYHNSDLHCRWVWTCMLVAPKSMPCWSLDQAVEASEQGIGTNVNREAMLEFALLAEVSNVIVACTQSLCIMTCLLCIA